MRKFLPEWSNIDESYLAALAAKFGTPLVVYSEEVLHENAMNLINTFPHGTKLAYSIKANPNPFILRTFHNLGLLAEVASEGEFHHALAQGLPASNLLFGGPGMPKSALQTAKQYGARAVLLESKNAITRAGQTGISDIPILLRVNPHGLESNVETRMTGMASPFGIDEGNIPSAIMKAQQLGLDYAGLFLYVGTQVAGAEAIAANTHHLLNLNERLIASGLPPARIFDFGGGFPVPESPDHETLDLITLRSEFEKISLLRPSTSTTMMFESGRFLVDNAAILLTSVLDSKVSVNQHFVILDAGINVLGLRQLQYRTHTPELRPILQKSTTLRSTNFVGPTCTPIDIVAKKLLMPPLREGDLICVPRFGAYSVSFSPTAFCGQGYPTEIALFRDGTVHLTRSTLTR